MADQDILILSLGNLSTLLISYEEPRLLEDKVNLTTNRNFLTNQGRENCPFLTSENSQKSLGLLKI